MEGRSLAPVYKVAKREVIAVEHPMIVKNLDNGLKTFGTNRPFRRILDSDDPEECLPLYLRHDDPMCVPLLSHNSPTSNVLLQVTVPKRTGRKRKRGSQDPYTDPNEAHSSCPKIDASVTQEAPPTCIRSQGRLDNPGEFMRSLKDNIGKYTIEVAGEINQTHRFRGLSDFHQSTSNTSFVPRLEALVLPGKLEDIRKFKLDPKVGWKPNEEILPPPTYTNHPLPYNWAWHQNPNIFNEVNHETGNQMLVNRSKPSHVKISHIPHSSKNLPTAPLSAIPDEAPLQLLVKDLREAMEERPIWSRRALVNRIGASPFLWLLKRGLQYVSYQFKGGPWRDGIIKLGVDPRTDPKYRIYQTMFFKIYEDEERQPGMPWHDIRSGYTLTKRSNLEVPKTTHIFDGKTLTLDGKVWQMCDIADPLLARLIRDAPYRPTCQTTSDGWFTNAALAKIKAIMKVKLIAIRANKTLTDEDFATALEHPDNLYPAEKTSRKIHIPVPDIRLSEEEVEEMRKRGIANAVTSNGIRRREGAEKKMRERMRTSGIVSKEARAGVGNSVPQKSRQRRKKSTRPGQRPVVAADGQDQVPVDDRGKEGSSGNGTNSNNKPGYASVDPELLAEYEEYKRAMAEGDEEIDDSDDRDDDSEAESGDHNEGEGNEDEDDNDSNATDFVDYPKVTEPRC